MVSFHTDGEIFLYTIQDEELHPHMYASGTDGKLRKIFMDEQHIPLHGFVGQNEIYYVSYDREAKYSYLKSCNFDFKNCQVLIEMSGVIRNPVETDGGKILFQHSRYDEVANYHAGYSFFQFYFYNKKSLNITKVDGASFKAVGPVVYLDETVHFPAIYVGENNNILNADGTINNSDSYSGKITGKKITITRNANSIVGRSLLYLKFKLGSRYVYYAGFPSSKDGNYVYQTCVLPMRISQSCDASETKTSYPVPVGKYVYFAVWKPETTSVSIIKM